MALNLKKKLPLIMMAALAVSLVGAVVLIILGFRADAAYKKVMEFILGGLMLALAAVLGIYLLLTRDVEPNFFLFDREKKKNIPVENLTFKIINERMSFFLTMVCEREEELWQENVLEQERKMGYRRVYRPLLAYKMLYDLGEKNLATYWDLLLGASEELVGSLCDAMKQGGEKEELIRVFRYSMENCRSTPEKIKDFISGNKAYFARQMKEYIKKNIELFY